MDKRCGTLLLVIITNLFKMLVNMTSNIQNALKIGTKKIIKLLHDFVTRHFHLFISNLLNLIHPRRFRISYLLDIGLLILHIIISCLLHFLNRNLDSLLMISLSSFNPFGISLCKLTLANIFFIWFSFLWLSILNLNMCELLCYIMLFYIWFYC